MSDNENKVLRVRAWWVRAIYTAASLYILITLFLFTGSKYFHPEIEFFAQLTRFMFGGSFVIFPVCAIVLWFLNRPCRTLHTTFQKKYLIASRIIFSVGCIPALIFASFISILAIDQCRNTKRSTTTTPLTGGHKLIVKQTISPGLTDANIKRTVVIRWASGRIEALPFKFDGIAQHTSNVLEAGGHVLLPAGRFLLYRPGTIASEQGTWRIWNPPSQPLYAFLRQYAQEHGDVGITITSDQEPHGEPITYIRYDGMGYFASAERVYMPHLIKSIDPTTLQIVMSLNKPIAPMPEHLVFSAIHTPSLTWEFDEPATKTYKTRTSMLNMPTANERTFTKTPLDDFFIPTRFSTLINTISLPTMS